jgi:hypothetical protein
LEAKVLTKKEEEVVAEESALLTYFIANWLFKMMSAMEEEVVAHLKVAEEEVEIAGAQEGVVEAVALMEEVEAVILMGEVEA